MIKLPIRVFWCGLCLHIFLFCACASGANPRRLHEQVFSLGDLDQMPEIGGLSIRNLIDSGLFDRLEFANDSRAIFSILSERRDYEQVALEVEVRSSANDALRFFNQVSAEAVSASPIQSQGEYRDTKYCLTYVRQERADAMGGGGPLDSYYSEAIVQKGRLVIVMYEFSRSTDNLMKWNVFERLVASMNAKVKEKSQ